MVLLQFLLITTKECNLPLMFNFIITYNNGVLTDDYSGVMPLYSYCYGFNTTYGHKFSHVKSIKRLILKLVSNVDLLF